MVVGVLHLLPREKSKLWRGFAEVALLLLCNRVSIRTRYRRCPVQAVNAGGVDLYSYVQLQRIGFYMLNMQTPEPCMLVRAAGYIRYSSYGNHQIIQQIMDAVDCAIDTKRHRSPSQ